MMIPPAIYCSASVGTPRSTVDNLSSRVNITIDIAKLSVMSNGLLRLGRELSRASDPPMMTGIKGSMHGAAIVRTPARNETISKVIAPSCP